MKEVLRLIGYRIFLLKFCSNCNPLRETDETGAATYTEFPLDSDLLG